MFRLAVLIVLALAPPGFAAGPKNVLLVVADDMGLQAGCYGDTQARTPRLDALAKQGTTFTRAFASVSSCSPSRATLLTGLPTHQCGQYGLAHATHNSRSFPGVKSLPGLLNAAGYVTGVVGKLHVAPKEVYPFTAEVAATGRDGVDVARKAKAFIESAGDKPFFLLAGLTDPHRQAGGFGNNLKLPASIPRDRFDPAAVTLPNFLPETPEARTDWADYLQSVSRFDHNLGLLLDLLVELKLADSTLVIVLSDNGPPFPGAKTTLYDAGVRLPLVVRSPGKPGGLRPDSLVSWTDIAPTVLDWAGVKPPAAMRGRSVLPFAASAAADATGWDRVYASHQQHEVTMYYPMRMVRTSAHKLILNLAHPLEFPVAADLWEGKSWQAALKRPDLPVGARSRAAFTHRPRVELYDLIADPAEVVNLADKPGHADRVRDMLADLHAWREKTADPWLVKDKHE